mmetsp:Transcript_35568/g.87479  ORF Transcript_35568/g.87479 Transcript_35568/m.87479 type:complete len:218 (+) Transcript_35568:211-864(+)
MLSNPSRRVLGTSRSGTCLLVSSWGSLIALLGTYLALYPYEQPTARRELLQRAGTGQMAEHARMSALKGCVCEDSPLAGIHEVNVFPGPSKDGSSQFYGVPPEAVSEGCCGPMTWKEMHSVYEITEPNVPKWKEYKPPNNVFPGIIDWDPDSPNQAGSARKTKPLFDENGGILGLEASDGWSRTPGSVAPDEQGKYSDGKEGRDKNVFAHGYKFPHY